MLRRHVGAKSLHALMVASAPLCAAAAAAAAERQSRLPS